MKNTDTGTSFKDARVKTAPYRLGIGEYAIESGPKILQTHGLGSCVAICLHDSTQMAGALLHAMLPYHSEIQDSHRWRFADTGTRGISTLLKREHDVALGDLEAKLIGGSKMFNGSSFTIGERNIIAARETLDYLGIDVVAEDTGGQSGRTVEFNLETGMITVRNSIGHTTRL